MRTLVWFRRDLRTHDHPALTHACRQGDDGVIGVFLLQPDQWKEHDEAPIKIDLLLRTLSELSRALSEKNIPLRVVTVGRFDGAPAALTKVAEETGCEALVFHAEYPIHERRRDRAVREAFEGAGLTVDVFHDQVLFEPGEVLTKAGDVYGVYTPFRRNVSQRLITEGVPSPLPAPTKQPDTGVSPDEVPEAIAGFKRFPKGSEARWPAGEEAARKRLQAFVDEGLSRYHEERDLPGIESTSKLSPYLALGMISVTQCLHAALQVDPDALDMRHRSGPSVWVSELLWREFYKHLLVGFPRVSRHGSFHRQYDGLPWRDSEADFDAWCEGRTGYPFVDAAMRQLKATGWMHNRMRMVVAMFLSKHLLLDWRKGEQFFMRHLVDGDLAANNGGWQWSASTGADGAPYFRIFNPISQGQRFDPDGAYILRWVPELEGLTGKDLHQPWRVGKEEVERRGYVMPIVDQKAGRERAIAAFKAYREDL